MYYTGQNDSHNHLNPSYMCRTLLNPGGRTARTLTFALVVALVFSSCEKTGLTTSSPISPLSGGGPTGPGGPPPPPLFTWWTAMPKIPYTINSKTAPTEIEQSVGFSINGKGYALGGVLFSKS